MNVSDEGLIFIMQHEGMKLNAYPDPATGGDPWTIGIGHTTGVRSGDTCTQEQAMEWLREDCVTAEKCIANSVKVALTQPQYDALVSLIFNIGCGNFGKSTLLRHLNEGDDAAAADQFLVWNKAAGHVMAGLTNRREAEKELFLT